MPNVIDVGIGGVHAPQMVTSFGYDYVTNKYKWISTGEPEWVKGSSDPSHFIFEINVGKSRIRHRTTLNLNLQPIFSRSRNSPFSFRVVVCRIRLFPTLISRIKWLGSELPLKIRF